MTTCKHCGNDYEPINGKQKYCSHDCYYVGVLKRSNKIRIEKKAVLVKNIRECIICGKEFLTNRYKLSCSPECAKEHNRRKDKERIVMERNSECSGQLVPSKCPMCELHHKADTSHSYCHNCRASVNRGHIPDMFEGGRVFANARSHRAAA